MLIICLFTCFSFATEIKGKIEKSLTQKYIDSLREGKWGITDPDWVNLALAKSFFPKATKLSSLEGIPPSVSVFSKGKLVAIYLLQKILPLPKVIHLKHLKC